MARPAERHDRQYPDGRHKGLLAVSREDDWDGAGQARRIREVEPLVVGSLDLRREYDADVAGARQNAGLKRLVLQFVCQFPTALKLESKTHERWMLNQADFAAGFDRDEAGRHAVGVFVAPKYEKRAPPDQQGEIWISPTKNGKLLYGSKRF